MRQEHVHTIWLSLAIAALSLLAPCAKGQEAPQPAITIQVDTAAPAEKIATENVSTGKVLTVKDKTKPALNGLHYWLGVSCLNVKDELRAQLKLPTGGVLVSHLHENTPAAKAGLKLYDILLLAGDKPLNSPEDLAAVVNEAGENEVKLTLLRGGERQKLRVKPEVRPDLLQTTVNLDFTPAEHPLRLSFVRPGQLVAQPFTKKLIMPETPEGLKFTVTKDGKEKAKWHIEQGDKSWDLTEDKFSELPPKTRAYMEMLSRRTMFDAPAPGANGDVLVFTPDGGNIVWSVATPAVPAGTVTVEGSAATAVRATAQGALEQYRQALVEAQAAQELAQQKLREVEEQYRPSRIIAEHVTPKVEEGIEQARKWSLKNLDSRFDQVQKQLDELRAAVKSLQADQPEEKIPEAKP